MAAQFLKSRGDHGLPSLPYDGAPGFEQGNLKKYQNLQQVLILAAGRKNSDEKLDQVLEFYSGDFDNWKLQKLS